MKNNLETSLGLVRLLGRRDDVGKLGLEGSTTDEGSVNVGAEAELLGVLGSDGSSVDDAGLVGDLLRDALRKEFTDDLVRVLSLLRGRDLFKNGIK